MAIIPAMMTMLGAGAAAAKAAQTILNKNTGNTSTKVETTPASTSSGGSTSTRPTGSSRPSTSSGPSVAQATTVNVPNDARVTGVDDYGETDYSVALSRAMGAGASAEEVRDLLDKRVQKAVDKGYTEYIHDDVYKTAQDYIMNNSQTTEDTYDKTPSKSGSSSASKYDLSGVGTQQIAAQVESQLAGIRGAYEKGMQAYDEELEDLPERYQAAKNDAAAQSAMAKKNFDEQANAVGLNSGTSGQAALDASATYRGALAQLGQAQASDAAEIDRAKALLTAEYEQAIAQAVADGDAAKAELKFNEMLRVQGLLRQDEQIAYDRAQAEKQWDYAVEQDAKAWEYTLAQEEYNRKLAAAEIMAQIGRFDGYAELWGLPEDVVEALVTKYAEAEQLTKEEAARQLAAWHAQFGDFSKLKELGVDTTMLEKSQW